MHESWHDEGDGARDKTYQTLKPAQEEIHAEAVQYMLRNDAMDVFATMDTINSAFMDMKSGDKGTPHEIVERMAPNEVSALLAWSSIGIQGSFLRALETAVMNDQMEDE